MSFSVYGRIGGQNANNVSNYGRNSYFPTVRPARSYLNSGVSRPRVYATTVNNTTSQPYNPKSQTLQKKDNKNLKTALLVAGAATAAFVARKPIEKCVTGVKGALSSGVKSYAKHCPNMAQAGKSFAQACKTPVNACKSVGKAIAKPFVAIAKLFAKKP